MYSKNQRLAESLARQVSLERNMAKSMRIGKVVSAGQVGAEALALEAAKELGIPTGGWAPRGFLTAGGLRPELAELFGLRELESPGYRAALVRNVADCDAVLIVRTAGRPISDTVKVAADLAQEYKRPSVVAITNEDRTVLEALAFLRQSLPKGLATILCTGAREVDGARGTFRKVFEAINGRL